MSDDLDELLRRAMSTLDRQVPDGYFDALPARTLARLDAPADLDGLDELARERAARGARTQPAPPDDLASTARSSADAPEPAIEIDAGPRPVPRPIDKERDPVPGTPARARPRRAIVAVGAGLAAAVVLLLFVSPQMRTAMSPLKQRAILPEASVTRGDRADTPRALAAPSESEIEKTDPAPPTTLHAPSREPSQVRTPSPEPAPPQPSSSAPSRPPASSQRPLPAPGAPSAGIVDPSTGEQLGAPPPTPPAQLDGAEPPAAASTEGLGRGAPRSVAHSIAAPEPSAADVALAARTLTPKLEACLRGASGNAMVDATLLPSGRVSAVRVSPPFAGTAREACVRRVVESLHFPSWTGSPRTYRFAITAPEVRSIPQAPPADGRPSHP